MFTFGDHRRLENVKSNWAEAKIKSLGFGSSNGEPVVDFTLQPKQLKIFAGVFKTKPSKIRSVRSMTFNLKV